MQKVGYRKNRRGLGTNPLLGSLKVNCCDVFLFSINEDSIYSVFYSS